MRVYYHNDQDGRCAAAIAYRFVSKNDFNLESLIMIELDYKDHIDINDIGEREKIIILDFSFKPEIMEKILLKTHEVFWLDHHKTAFEYVYSKDIKGIRDINYSGCELAWLYFYPEKPMPRPVELIGDYDKWALKYQPDCFEFYEGLKLRETSNPRANIWANLLFDLAKETKIIEHIILEGRTAIRYRDNYCENLRKSYGYETKIDGHLAYATNFYMFGSKGFGDKFDQYPICIAYIHDGDKFTISLYSKNIDVSEIAKKHGGGGHSGAAGMVVKELPFTKK